MSQPATCFWCHRPGPFTRLPNGMWYHLGGGSGHSGCCGSFPEDTTAWPPKDSRGYILVSLGDARIDSRREGT